MLLLLIAPALAASAAPIAGPEASGFRQHAAGTTNQFSGRLVIAPGEITVFQQVPRVRIGNNRTSLDLSLPLVQAIGPDSWSEVGLGRTRTEGRLHLGLERKVALGLSAGGVFVPESLWVTTWGSQSRETQPGWDVTGFVEIDLPVDLPWTLAIGGGMGPERYLNLIVPFLIDVRSFQTVPISDRLSLIMEEELVLIEHTILSVRGLVSWQTASALTVDVGVQMPLLSITLATLWPQAIAQVRTTL